MATKKNSHVFVFPLSRHPYNCNEDLHDLTGNYNVSVRVPAGLTRYHQPTIHENTAGLPRFSSENITGKSNYNVENLKKQQELYQKDDTICNKPNRDERISSVTASGRHLIAKSETESRSSTDMCLQILQSTVW